jgi:two-component system, OmpR family, response regulator
MKTTRCLAQSQHETPGQRCLARSAAESAARRGEPGIPAPGSRGGAAGWRILLVDGDLGIRGLVGRALSSAGYRVDLAVSGGEALRLARRRDHDLVILEVILPDMDGHAVLTELLRQRPGQALLVLSSLTDVVTKVECLDLGAQDYLTKPFSLAELLARVRVQIRGNAHLTGELLRAGAVLLDVGRLQAQTGRKPVALTRLEFLTLLQLMEHPGQSVGKAQLLASVWGYDFDPGSNVVDVCVRRLRSKLGFDLIKTVRGEGYRLAA